MNNMKIEYEVRKLNISAEDVISQIKAIGGKLLGIFHQRRYVYDFDPPVKGRWIRLRSNGKLTTLAIKEIQNKGIDGTEELEIVVSDFDDTNSMLEKLGYSPRTYQENFRIEFKLNNVNFDLDKWPQIPPYLEIEGNTKEDVINAMSKLSIEQSDVTTNDIDTVYKEYGINLDDIKHLSFNVEERKQVDLLTQYANGDIQMNDDVTIAIIDADGKDLFELEKFLNLHRLPVKRKQNDPNINELGGTELGVLIITLSPLAIPMITQLREVLKSYLEYKATTMKKKIVLEKNGKKLEMESGNGKFPDVADFEKFFRTK